MLIDRISKGRTGDGSTLRRALLAVAFALGTGAAHADDPNNKWGFFEQYCEKCHNSTDWAGGVAFDAMSPDSIGDDAKELEEAVRKLQGRLMPPPGKPQPDQQSVDNMVSWLTARLDETGTAHPNPGSVVIHRLNRTEYAREIKDLLAINIDAAALLPKDTPNAWRD